MSNIQITENRLGKYSPEWFYNESQTSECQILFTYDSTTIWNKYLAFQQSVSDFYICEKQRIRIKKC